MNVTTDQIVRFKKMMEDVGAPRDCQINWVFTSEEPMEFVIEHPEYNAMRFGFNWQYQRSLTDAGMNVWARYFEDRTKRVVPDDLYPPRSAFYSMPKITKVIYSEPATIVFWSDKTKTVVKCQEGDEFDPEKGLAMAMVKKMLGNQGNYYNTFSKWLEKYEPDDATPKITFNMSGSTALSEALKKTKEALLQAICNAYVPVTEHYGYIRVRDAEIGYAYKVCHKNEAHILRANPLQDWSPTGCNESSARLICEALEHKHYDNATEE